MNHPITDPAILDGYNGDALGYRGSPAGLFRPESEEEIVEILRWADDTGETLTPAALRSATTGSCVCHGGYLLSTEKLQAVRDIRPETRTVVVQPGLNLGQLKRELEAHGLFFPVDPTSENDCTVGGAAATNASGARTLKYGAMRRWVRRLRVVVPPGQVLDLPAAAVDKNAAGYFGFQDPVQFFIGSEGTLGILTEVELRCLDLPPDDLSFYAFFADEPATLAAAAEIRRQALGVRCLEYFDRACLDLLRREHGAPFPAEAGGMLFFEEEFPAGESERVLEHWLERLETLGARVDDTMVGDTHARKMEMKEFRHAIPATLNERGIRLRGDGGGKISSDWAVSFAEVAAVIAAARDICRRQDVAEVYCYGHIGNGHPHFNLLAPDADARERARRAIHGMCALVAACGGTISAEHGIGKVKKEFLRYCYAPQTIAWMKGFKRMLDPKLVLAPGNIFDFDA